MSHTSFPEGHKSSPITRAHLSSKSQAHDIPVNKDGNNWQAAHNNAQQPEQDEQLALQPLCHRGGRRGVGQPLFLLFFPLSHRNLHLAAHHHHKDISLRPLLVVVVHLLSHLLALPTILAGGVLKRQQVQVALALLAHHLSTDSALTTILSDVTNSDGFATAPRTILTEKM